MCVHAHVCMCKCVLTPLSWVTRTKHGAEWGESSSPHSVPAALQSFCTYWMFLTRSYFLPHSTRPLWPAFLLLASIPCSFQHSSFWLLQLSILLPRIWKRSLQPLEDPWHLSQVCAADSNNDLRILIFFFSKQPRWSLIYISHECVTRNCIKCLFMSTGIKSIVFSLTTKTFTLITEKKSKLFWHNLFLASLWYLLFWKITAFPQWLLPVLWCVM